MTWEACSGRIGASRTWAPDACSVMYAATLAASSEPPAFARSYDVRSGTRPSVSPRSPNWRSRSTAATRWPASASATARLAVVSVLPMPPLGPSTQISSPASCLVSRALVPCRRATAFSTAKRSSSDGSPISSATTTSSAPASKIRRMKPFGDVPVTTTTARSGRSRTASSMTPSITGDSGRETTTRTSAAWPRTSSQSSPGSARPTRRRSCSGGERRLDRLPVEPGLDRHEGVDGPHCVGPPVIVTVFLSVCLIVALKLRPLLAPAQDRVERRGLRRALLGPGRGAQQDPDLPVVGGVRERDRLTVADPEDDALVRGLALVAAFDRLGAGAQHELVLQQRLHDARALAGRRVARGVAREHVDVVTGLHLADQAVRLVDRHRDRPLGVRELRQHGARRRDEARGGELLAGVDVGGRDLAGERVRGPRSLPA